MEHHFKKHFITKYIKKNIANNFVDKKLTRRDNGEGEIRFLIKKPYMRAFKFLDMKMLDYPFKNGNPVLSFSTTLLPSGRSQAVDLSSFEK